jgi:hypothetical protein
VSDVDLVHCPRCGSGFREPLWSLTRLEQEATKVTWRPGLIEHQTKSLCPMGTVEGVSPRRFHVMDH